MTRKCFRKFRRASSACARRNRSSFSGRPSIQMVPLRAGVIEEGRYNGMSADDGTSSSSLSLSASSRSRFARPGMYNFWIGRRRVIFLRSATSLSVNGKRAGVHFVHVDDSTKASDDSLLFFDLQEGNNELPPQKWSDGAVHHASRRRLLLC